MGPQESDNAGLHITRCNFEMHRDKIRKNPVSQISINVHALVYCLLIMFSVREDCGDDVFDVNIC